MHTNANECVRKNKQTFIYLFHKPQTKFLNNLLKQVQNKAWHLINMNARKIIQWIKKKKKIFKTKTI